MNWATTFLNCLFYCRCEPTSPLVILRKRSDRRISYSPFLFTSFRVRVTKRASLRALRLLSFCSGQASRGNPGKTKPWIRNTKRSRAESDRARNARVKCKTGEGYCILSCILLFYFCSLVLVFWSWYFGTT
jgi:hypothetical protein